MPGVQTCALPIFARQSFLCQEEPILPYQLQLAEPRTQGSNKPMNKIIFGENLQMLREIESGSVDLIYIDPPFNTGKVQSRKELQTVRSVNGKHRGFQGKNYEVSLVGQRTFRDIFDAKGDYERFLRPRLYEAHRILAPHGTLYFHIDWREVHYCRILLDTIFGRKCFLNEIIWAYDYGARSKKKWSAKHDNILVYVKNPDSYTFRVEDMERIRYMAPGLVSEEKRKRGKRITDTWWHTIVPTAGKEKTGYPTQKPLGILRRIIEVSSNPGDLVVDFFAGSGSTGQAVLEQNNLDNGKRQFILCTNNEANIATEVTFPRIKNVMNGYQQTKNQKEILFEVPLNTKVLVNNTIILDAIERFDSIENQRRYDLIKKEVRKNKFVISGIIKKRQKVSGFGNSLKYYRTDFIDEDTLPDATDEDKSILAGKAGLLLSIAKNTLEEVEQTDHFQIFENSRSATAIYYREELDEMDLFAEKIKNINKSVSLYFIGRGNKNNFERLFAHFNNISLEAIPQRIVEFYDKIYKAL